MISNLEKSFAYKALLQNIRADLRNSTTFREAKFDFDNNQRGLVTVSFGESKVLALASATVIRPYPDRPSEGLVNYFLELSRLAINHDEYLEVEEEQSRLQRLVDRVFKNSRMVDTESLCIIPGEKVWSIRVDIHVLDHDGNLSDTCVAAVMAALLDYRRPETTITEEGALIIVSNLHTAFEKHPVPLALHNPIICVTFALLDPEVESSDHSTKVASQIIPIVDPTLLEESLRGGRLHLALNRHGEIATLIKTGGDAIDLETIEMECLSLARQRCINILDLIQASIIKSRGSTK